LTLEKRLNKEWLGSIVEMRKKRDKLEKLNRF
jgi:hypothetical protein